MRREIKFRLIKDSKIVGYEWHNINPNSDVAIMHSKDGREWVNIHLRPENYIAHDNKEQFTGLKDKNGKGTNEVYEGDIVICSCKPTLKFRYKGVIKYNAPEFYLACFWEDIDGEQCWYPVGENNRSLIDGVWSIDEILGDIHTKPELIEDKKDE